MTIKSEIVPSELDLFSGQCFTVKFFMTFFRCKEFVEEDSIIGTLAKDRCSKWRIDQNLGIL